MERINGSSGTESKVPPGLFDSLLQIFFPERCLLCRSVISLSHPVPLCSDCAESYSGVLSICPRCEDFSADRLSCACNQTATALSSLTALNLYDNQWRKMLHNLKYRRRRFLARPLGKWLGREISLSRDKRFDLVVPVPLHKKRERERGFNQSALIARHCAGILGIPFEEILKKSRETVSQTTITRQERILNVRDAFTVSRVLPRGTLILLVDDIYSTGSTLKEAAGELKKNGAEVHGAVIAYNPPRFTKS